MSGNQCSSQYISNDLGKAETKGIYIVIYVYVYFDIVIDNEQNNRESLRGYVVDKLQESRIFPT